MTTPKIILIVEDELSMFNVLRDKFSREGFSTLEARSGGQGLEVALANHPDLILLDIIMPGIDGLTMLKKLRAENKWGKSVPVIMLTNSNDAKKLSEATVYGTNEYLLKSDWKIENIVKKVKEKLKIQ